MKKKNERLLTNQSFLETYEPYLIDFYKERIDGLDYYVYRSKYHQVNGETRDQRTPG